MDLEHDLALEMSQARPSLGTALGRGQTHLCGIELRNAVQEPWIRILSGVLRSEGSACVEGVDDLVGRLFLVLADQSLQRGELLVDRVLVLSEAQGLLGQLRRQVLDRPLVLLDLLDVAQDILIHASDVARLDQSDRVSGQPESRVHDWLGQAYLRSLLVVVGQRVGLLQGLLGGVPDEVLHHGRQFAHGARLGFFEILFHLHFFLNLRHDLGNLRKRLWRNGLGRCGRGGNVVVRFWCRGSGRWRSVDGSRLGWRLP